MQSESRLLEHVPCFDVEAAASLAKKLYGIGGSANTLPSERDQNFLLTSDSGDKFVLKIANSLEDESLLAAQNRILTHVGARLPFCQRLIPTLSGEVITLTKSPSGEMNFVRLVTYLSGVPLAEARPHTSALLKDLGAKLGRLDRELANLDTPAVHRDFHWDLANGLRVIREYGTLIRDRDLRELVWQCARDFERDLIPLLPRLRRSVIHNDANDYNVLVHAGAGKQEPKTVSGLIDFGDVVYSYTVGELAVAIAYVVLDKPSPITAAVDVVAGYTAENPLEEAEIDALYPLVLLRLCMSVCLGAYQHRQRPGNEYLKISQSSIANSLPRLMAIDSRLAAAAFRCAYGSQYLKKADTLDRRVRFLAGNLKLSFKDPVKIVRGWMQYLYDEDGRQYTDAYNNVVHVGHCHPSIVRAGQEQMALLNTNTRYLNDLICAWAERLTATLPEPLRVCFFVNSGSEANELALRLARAHTNASDLIVLEHAYHGHTTTLIDISPYKHDGPGGRGAPSWVHKVPLPDLYRGLYRSGESDATEKYARYVDEIISQLHEQGVGLAGFISESMPSVAGQIVFPNGYLKKVYAAVRAADGVCIADEVQTGYGRIGTHFWAFQTYDVVPDIVVLGKPIGNGHPIGAVVTTREIAESFDNGMEFFSTFGGNTVSCAIGLSVLDLVLKEDMQSHALSVGGRMAHGLRRLMNTYPLIGDVRGSGFFLGVELVRNRSDLEPASAEAEIAVNRLRDHGILLGTDGPFHNVLKIRPPMPFSEADADRLVATLDQVLAEL